MQVGEEPRGFSDELYMLVWVKHEAHVVVLRTPMHRMGSYAVVVDAHILDVSYAMVGLVWARTLLGLFSESEAK